MARILIVEDNFDVADAMRMLLEAGGHQARIAGSVAEAVRSCDESPVDIMLLDVTLPDGEGLEVLSRATTPPAVTLALTGWDEPAIVARCLAAGCRDVLIKPVPAKVLLALPAQHAP